MNGCGASVCAADLYTCNDCLGGVGTDSSGQYSWSPYTNECVEDCMHAPADAPCYKGKSSVDPSGYDPSICPEISDSPTPAPFALIENCSDASDCDSCLDAGSNCMWWSDIGYCEEVGY
jgi:hypothetical protein